MKHFPPGWAQKFLRWYCRPDLLEEIEGDAHELFYRKVKESERMAKLQFVWNVIRFFRIKNIRKRSTNNYNSVISSAMIKNILKISTRNFMRQPGHSFLTLFGLSVGFTAAFLILLWVTHEYSFDRFHADKEKISLLTD